MTFGKVRKHCSHRSAVGLIVSVAPATVTWVASVTPIVVIRVSSADPQQQTFWTKLGMSQVDPEQTFRIALRNRLKSVTISIGGHEMASDRGMVSGGLTRRWRHR